MTSGSRDSGPHEKHKPGSNEAPVPETRGETETGAILGVFRELSLDDSEVRDKMKRLAEGWDTELAAAEPELMIRRDTATNG